MIFNPRSSFSARSLSLATPAFILLVFLTLLLLGRLSFRTCYTPSYPAWTPTNQAPSAWFSGTGYLRFDGAEGWGTVYETRASGLGGHSCDSEKDMPSGAKLCLSTIRLWRALYTNSVIQHRILGAQDEASGNGADLKVSREDEKSLRRSYEDLEGLRGKRILYLGDSTDRNAIDEMARAMPTSNWHMYEPVSGKEIPEFPGDVSQHTTRFLSVRLANSAVNSTKSLGPAFQLKDTTHSDEFRVDFLFTFGLSEFPANDAQPEDFLERINLLDHLVGRKTRYDLICVNAGLWDLEKFAREYPDREPVAGLTADWIDSYISRYILAIGRLRATFGAETPIAIRLLHDLVPVEKGLRFTPLRAGQLRQAQLEVVRRMGVRTLPFAELMREQPFHYTPDGAHPNPAGNMLHSELMLRLLVEA